MSGRNLPELARSLSLAVFFFLLPALGAAADSSGKQVYPQWGSLAPGPYRVGFHSSVVFDPSRSYYPPRFEPGGASSRPIQISLWYPATPVENQPQMPFSEYLVLSDRERNLADWTEEEKQALLRKRVDALQQTGVEPAAARAHFGKLTAPSPAPSPPRGVSPYWCSVPACWPARSTTPSCASTWPATATW